MEDFVLVILDVGVTISRQARNCDDKRPTSIKLLFIEINFVVMLYQNSSK